MRGTAGERAGLLKLPSEGSHCAHLGLVIRTGAWSHDAETGGLAGNLDRRTWGVEGLTPALPSDPPLHLQIPGPAPVLRPQELG